MASHRTDKYTSTGMTGSGTDYTVVSNATTVVKAAPGRLCRVVVTAGTGTITVYDNASTASGAVLWTKTAVAVGDIYPVDSPANNGIVAVVAASTTANIIWS